MALLGANLFVVQGFEKVKFPRLTCKSLKRERSQLSCYFFLADLRDDDRPSWIHDCGRTFWWKDNGLQGVGWRSWRHQRTSRTISHLTILFKVGQFFSQQGVIWLEIIPFLMGTNVSIWILFNRNSHSTFSILSNVGFDGGEQSTNLRHQSESHNHGTTVRSVWSGIPRMVGWNISGELPSFCYFAGMICFIVFSLKQCFLCLHDVVIWQSILILM